MFGARVSEQKLTTSLIVQIVQQLTEFQGVAGHLTVIEEHVAGELLP